MSSYKGKSASRYSSFDSQSSTSSSADLKSRNNCPSNGSLIPEASRTKSNSVIVKANKPRNEQNFAAMVKKFMEKRSTSSWNSKTAKENMPLIVPADFIAEDLKKTARKGSNLAAVLPKKLFGKGGSGGDKGLSSGEKKVKALTEVKTNTRTLAMVLRSERELLGLNKEQEAQIALLNSFLEERNREVEKLKDLCLKQREEIKALKSAILFPDEMNSQLQELLEKQGSELKQARQVIPTLQRQVSSLTGQLQNLSEDLAEVKAVKYSGRPFIDGNFSSPRTPMYNQEETANSLDYGSSDPTTPNSPDDMLLKDINPCLTPCYSKRKSKECKAYDSAEDEEACESPLARTLSRSSDHFSSSRTEGNRGRATFYSSTESKCRYRKRIDHEVF